MIGVAVLGSTGSIGVSTLDVIARHPDRFEVIALTAHASVERMVEQCVQFKPQFAVMVDEQAANQLSNRLIAEGLATQVFSSSDALNQVASLDQVDYVMAAIVGAAGLPSSIAAAKAGKRILLANKESLVMSGDLFMQEVAANGAELLPIDSEHNAIFQCMPSAVVDGERSRLNRVGVDKILLTASGGPFLKAPLDSLSSVTPDQACAHPKWKMGRKISVDSATMMNKGLEVIEACWLFNASPQQVQVVIHPESMVHSMVSYHDGSVLAELGNPDMRTPIAHAMAWPERFDSGVAQLDIFEVAQLNFEKPDFDRFPCLRLAFEAAEKGQSAPAVLNAANEMAVAAFLNEQIRFTDIPEVIEQCLAQSTIVELNSLEQVLKVDQQTRELANSVISSLSVNS